MRYFLLLFLLVAPVLGEQTVAHGGNDIVTFDVPAVQYRGQKSGKVTRTFFSNPVGNGNLKITVRSKGWMSELVAEKSFEEDKTTKRRNQNMRLGKDPDIPGALKAFTYVMSDPYVAHSVIVYTKDFRCELMVTGTGDAAELLEPTFEQLIRTLKVVPRTKIGELKIGD